MNASAIIIKDTKILLLKDKGESSQEYYFPQVHVEESENADATLKEKLSSELSLPVSVQRFFHKTKTEEGLVDKYYLCSVDQDSDEFGETVKSFEKYLPNEDYELALVELDKLGSIPLYPLEVRNLIVKNLSTPYKYWSGPNINELSDYEKSFRPTPKLNIFPENLLAVLDIISRIFLTVFSLITFSLSLLLYYGEIDFVFSSPPSTAENITTGSFWPSITYTTNSGSRFEIFPKTLLLDEGGAFYYRTDPGKIRISQNIKADSEAYGSDILIRKWLPFFSLAIFGFVLLYLALRPRNKLV